MYQLIWCVLHAFLSHQELFVELFAGSQACVPYLYIHVRLTACHADHPAGEVVYLYRRAHVEHEYLSAVCVSSRLQH